MIKVIIKLDGTEEAFSPHKINGWGEWAAKELGDRVDWSAVVMDAVASLPSKCTSQELQQALIDQCLDRKTWSYYLMAGRLYAVLLRKKHYGTAGIPTVKALHTKMRKAGVIVKMDYSTQEYKQIEKLINHDLDLNCPHFSLHHTRRKYALQNRVTKEEFETQQFTYMRMAMALAEHEPRDVRMEHLKNFYWLFSNKKLSAPTPNYVNLGTVLKGFASCCLFATGDEGVSLAMGDYIANIMTQSAAGIGVNVMCRSIGDEVRKGLIIHQGKLPYYAVMGKSVGANLQNGRGGACNVFYNAFDPEANIISQLRNPRSPEDRRNRDLHYTLITNQFFDQKAAKNEDVFTWNIYTAPELHAAFYSKDNELFAELYAKREADPTFKKNYISARKLLLVALNEAYETGTTYWYNVDESNRHTPFLDAIHSSNLCVEIHEATIPYLNMMDLYSTEDHGRGEIATCSLAAIPVDNIENDKEYALASYYALKMIDYCINHAEYAFPHLAFTAKQRMSAAVGIMGLATHMARNQFSYSSPEGKRELHFVAERHAFHMISASLRIGKERGNAPWMHKTKWPSGWLPIDTYNRNVDTILEGGFELTYKWEPLRAEIIANGGIGHTVTCAHMPGEASSKALGGTNSLYGARRLVINKTDGNTVVQWAAPFGDDPAYKYHLAWDIPSDDMIDCYAVFQKFTDQGISADMFRRIVGEEKITTNEMLKQHFRMRKMGLKGRYYQNTETTDNLSLEALSSAFENVTEQMCPSGVCSV
jgi:ribonucleoside-diphosphate reductase alpha chain